MQTRYQVRFMTFKKIQKHVQVFGNSNLNYFWMLALVEAQGTSFWLQNYMRKRKVLHFSSFFAKMNHKLFLQNVPSLDIRQDPYRSCSPEAFCKKFKMPTKFTGKHLRQGLSFDKATSFDWNFIKKEVLVQVFSCEFCEIFKNTVF